MPLKVALIGCGTISEIMHVPALKLLGNYELTGLFDYNTSRAELLAGRAGGALFGKDYKQHLDKFDAAIVATPNNTHAAITMDLLQAGKHVLVEKPVAFSVAEVDEMIAAEAASVGRVCVGQVKRFYPLHHLLKEFIAGGSFGAVKSIDITYCVVFSYPMASDSFLKKETARGGVFFDMGVHFLDVLYWWLGPLQVKHYEDDACGGIDADSYGEFTAKNGTVPINMTLSRQRNLNNVIRVEFEKATIELQSTYQTDFTLEINGQKIASTPEGLGGRPYIMNNVDQLQSFYNAITNNTPVAVPLADAREVMTVMEAAYNNRKAISYEWERV